MAGIYMPALYNAWDICNAFSGDFTIIGRIGLWVLVNWKPIFFNSEFDVPEGLFGELRINNFLFFLYFLQNLSSVLASKCQLDL